MEKKMEKVFLFMHLEVSMRASGKMENGKCRTSTAAAAGNIVVPRLEVTDCVARNATPIEGRPTVFWSEAEHFADGRVRQSAAAHLMRRFGAFKEGGAVLDIGAGRGGLREYLPPTTTYVPVDVMGYEGVRTSVYKSRFTSPSC